MNSVLATVLTHTLGDDANVTIPDYRNESLYSSIQTKLYFMILYLSHVPSSQQTLSRFWDMMLFFILLVSSRRFNLKH